MRRSLKLESLGAGYRRAQFLASWAGVYCGTYGRHPPQQLVVTIVTVEEVLVGTNDLRIAAIVLEHQAILVTRHTTDFADISGLQLEDWS